MEVLDSLTDKELKDLLSEMTFFAAQQCRRRGANYPRGYAREYAVLPKGSDAETIAIDAIVYCYAPPLTGKQTAPRCPVDCAELKRLVKRRIVNTVKDLCKRQREDSLDELMERHSVDSKGRQNQSYLIGPEDESGNDCALLIHRSELRNALRRAAQSCAEHVDGDIANLMQAVWEACKNPARSDSRIWDDARARLNWDVPRFKRTKERFKRFMRPQLDGM